ncbi:hypothetical protein E2562_013735 [Oryza meyeriana var. granulata]|uniref:Uncharacterized protein n=1 Tax=Oryza meyeriana var. granulata TaxID=110450 RepID=A0A6G1BKG8_9ORYZ|nr:hypothetical protein E2562_013735 [Oryza meyeriana var. granulata]
MHVGPKSTELPLRDDEHTPLDATQRVEIPYEEIPSNNSIEDVNDPTIEVNIQPFCYPPEIEKMPSLGASKMRWSWLKGSTLAMKTKDT